MYGLPALLNNVQRKERNSLEKMKDGQQQGKPRVFVWSIHTATEISHFQEKQAIVDFIQGSVILKSIHTPGLGIQR